MYVPYCSSDLYIGTRDDSDVSGYYFHGKYIVKVGKMVALLVKMKEHQNIVTNQISYFNVFRQLQKI